MRRYSCLDEERIRVQACVREWTRARLLEPSQGARLEAEVRPGVRRTNVALRAGLALFTYLIVGASVLWTLDAFHLDGDRAIAVTTGVAAVVCIACAELLAGTLRFYRHGVEEALAVAAALLLIISAAAITQTFQSRGLTVALTVGAASLFYLYRRFGFVYSAIGAMVCAALIPFQLNLAPQWQRGVAAATLAALFAIARTKRLRAGDDFPGDEYATLQAAAWGGVYLTLNLRASDMLDGLLISRAGIGGWFYWGTYVAIWLLPAIGLRLGVREKDRGLLDVSLVMACATLVTNKPYLGWPRHEWDPILLGIVLMTAAIALRRWLSSGPGGERAGFTPVRLLESSRGAITLMNIASAGFQPAAPSPTAAPSGSDFGGGRSGGGGGGGSF